MGSDPEEQLAALEERGRKELRGRAELQDRDELERQKERAAELRARVKTALGQYQHRYLRAGLLVLAVLTIPAMFAGFIRHHEHKDVWEAVGAGGLVVFFCLMMLSSTDTLWQLLGSITAEEKWIGRLGFPLHGYLEALREYRSDTRYSSVTLTLRFKKPAPSNDELEAVLASAGAQVQVKERNGEQVAELGGFGAGNDAVVKLVHRLATPLALLHAKYELASATLR